MRFSSWLTWVVALRGVPINLLSAIFHLRSACLVLSSRLFSNLCPVLVPHVLINMGRNVGGIQGIAATSFGAGDPEPFSGLAEVVGLETVSFGKHLSLVGQTAASFGKHNPSDATGPSEISGRALCSP